MHRYIEVHTTSGKFVFSIFPDDKISSGNLGFNLLHVSE